MVLKIQRRGVPLVLYSYIPRTGGTWLRRVLKSLKVNYRYWRHGLEPNYAMAHTLLISHFRNAGYDERIGTVFSFVRHPVTYYESTWRILHEENWRIRTSEYKWHPHKSAALRWTFDFHVWVERMLDEEPAWFTRIVDLYVGPQGEEFVDFIGRYEELYKDTAEVLVRSGIVDKSEEELETFLQENHSNPINSTDKKSLPIVWDPILKSKVLGMEKAVIQRFYS